MNDPLGELWRRIRFLIVLVAVNYIPASRAVRVDPVIRQHGQERQAGNFQMRNAFFPKSSSRSSVV